MAIADDRARLDDLRRQFRARMTESRAAEAWREFHGRIALVLSGGGARGAYEAGALLAFQDAELPTHIVTATSIGGINAASFVAHSETVVGNAEPLLDTWGDLTPPAVGIEWTKYIFIGAGLIAASAGFGNLFAGLLADAGVTLHLHRPALTWLFLGLAGACFLLFYDKLSYIYYVYARYLRRHKWEPDERKLVISAAGNLLVAGFLVLVLDSLPLREQLLVKIVRHPWITAVVAGALLLAWAFRRRLRALVAHLSSVILMAPLGTGLFTNYERIRYLKKRIPFDRLQRSPIRLVLSATDLEHGEARFFTNAPIEALATDPGSSSQFVHGEVTSAPDLIPPIIAGSSLPMAYEPIALDGRLHADGAIVASQPIRPAILLGADVLLLVMMEPPTAGRVHVKTFVDVGLRSLEILMRQNLHSDLETLQWMNGFCERAAADVGARPEEIEVEFGTRTFRYIRPFAIYPEAPLAGTMLSFDGATSWPAIVHGYRDAIVRLDEFLAYARSTQFHGQRKLYHLAPMPR